MVFVRNLPHQLVEAFQSTFEEARDADLIVHVVDASHPDPASQISTVREVLGEAGARDVRELVVFNKADLINQADTMMLRGLEPDSMFVSARTGEGIESLLSRIDELLPDPSVDLTVVIPFDRGDLVATMHKEHRVLETDYDEDGTVVHALVSPEFAAQLEPFRRLAAIE